LGRAAMKITLEQVHRSVQIAAAVSAVIGMIVALVQLRDHINSVDENNRRVQIDAAEKAYREVDGLYIEFLKLCLQNSHLDCYSVADSSHAFDAEDQIKQKILYTMLTDVFEVAFIEYKASGLDFVPAIQTIREQQWKGWETYMRKFMSRRSYLTVYDDIKDEYDPRLISFMNTMAPKRSKLSAE
jgi:hypothetical protein